MMPAQQQDVLFLAAAVDRLASAYAKFIIQQGLGHCSCTGASVMEGRANSGMKFIRATVSKGRNLVAHRYIDSVTWSYSNCLARIRSVVTCYVIAVVLAQLLGNLMIKMHPKLPCDMICRKDVAFGATIAVIVMQLNLSN